MLGSNYLLYETVARSKPLIKIISRRVNYASIETVEYRDFLIKEKLRLRKLRFQELALNNDFKYFLTFTYDSNLYNEVDFATSLKRFFKRYVETYILVPERGEKKGRLHYHALVIDLPKGMKKAEFDKCDNLTRYTGEYTGIIECFKWGRAESRLIENNNYETAVMYLSKYLSKDFELKNVYSRNLKKSLDYELYDWNGKLFVDAVSLNNVLYRRYYVPKENIKKS